ncbi:inovirus-type Gp2 protein [Chitinibacter tainanensis]|uniref:inovirus-type Gp2 protein n=1 Tax=Chitinibacter tainanensis TaxID=230667 RepID=UPI0023573EC6|nr:inovirus-type Gp2 protein [Chitinibacter tainanensis]
MMWANELSGIDVTPFLFVSQPALSRAKNPILIPAEHQQRRGLRDSALAGNKSSVSGSTSTQPDMARRRQVVVIPASRQKVRQAYAPILDAIDAVTADAMRLMRRPAAVVLRFTLLQDGSPSEVMKRLAEHCFRVGGLRPGYVWVREIRPADYDDRPGDYPHYHAVLFFERRAHWIGPVVGMLRKLTARGWLESYHLSRDKQTKRLAVHDLKNPEAAINFRHHVGYLAKCNTKVREAGRRIFGRSKVAKLADGEPLLTPLEPSDGVALLANEVVSSVAPSSVLQVTRRAVAGFNRPAPWRCFRVANPSISFARDAPGPARPPPLPKMQV